MKELKISLKDLEEKLKELEIEEFEIMTIVSNVKFLYDYPILLETKEAREYLRKIEREYLD